MTSRQIVEYAEIRLPYLRKFGTRDESREYHLRRL